MCTTVKVVLIGDSCVGKSAVAQGLAELSCHPDAAQQEVGRSSPARATASGTLAPATRHHVPTLGVEFYQSFVTTVGPPDSIMKLNVWDMGGLPRVRSLISPYFHKADTLVLVYSRDDLATLHSLQTRWLRLPAVALTRPSLVYVVGTTLPAWCAKPGSLDPPRRARFTEALAAVVQAAVAAFPSAKQVVAIDTVIGCVHSCRALQTRLASDAVVHKVGTVCSGPLGTLLPERATRAKPWGCAVS